MERTEEPGQMYKLKRFFVLVWNQKCKKNIVKLSKGARRKFKKGAIFLRKGIKKLLVKIQRKDKPPRERAAHEEAMSTEPGQGEPLTANSIFKENHTRPEPFDMHSIDTTAGKDSCNSAINELCAHLMLMEGCIRNQAQIRQIHAKIAEQLITYMVKNNVGNTKNLKRLKNDHIEEYSKDQTVSEVMQLHSELEKKEESGVGAFVYIDNIKSRRIVANELTPTLHMKYIFVQHPHFRKAYESFYESVVSSLASRISYPKKERVMRDILLYAKVVRHVKTYITSKLDEVEKTKSVSDLYTYKTEEYIKNQMEMRESQNTAQDTPE